GGVAVDHRVHVAGGDTEEQIRLAELHEVVFALPVRLTDDADAKALGFQQPADDRHAERGMIDVGIAGDDDHVARIPAELIHLLPAHRQEWRRAETFGPVLGIVKQRLGSVHGEETGATKTGAEYSTKNDQQCRVIYSGMAVVPLRSRYRKRVSQGDCLALKRICAAPAALPW